MQPQAFGRRTRRVATRHDGAIVAMLVKFAETILAVRHGPYLTGQPEFPECHHAHVKGHTAQARGQRQRQRQVGGGLADLQAADQIHVGIVLGQLNRRVPAHDRQQHGEAVGIHALGDTPWC